MIKKQLIVTLLVCLILGSSFAQQETEQRNAFNYNSKPLYGGPGIGMDFGVIGVKGEYMFLDYIGVFGGAGFNLHNFCFNGGVILKPLAKEKFTPYLLGMYGYNGMIFIQGAQHLNRISYGFTPGFGLEIKTESGNAWQLGLLFPLRRASFLDYHQQLKDDPNVSISETLPKIGISIGFKIRA